MEHKQITINAKNISLGRIASKVAMILMGKDSPVYQANIIGNKSIKIINIDNIKLTGKKREQKKYKHYTGFPGGLKELSVADYSNKQLLIMAVSGMLPKNRSRVKLIQRLIIE